MIRVTWGDLKNNEFMESLARVFAAPMDFTNAQKCVLLGREIKKQQELSEEAHKKILEKFGVPDKERMGFYNIAEDKRDEYAEEMGKFAKHSFTVKVRALDARVISEKIEFSPRDLLLLENILAPLDGEETEVNNVVGVQEKGEPQAEAKSH